MAKRLAGRIIRLKDGRIVQLLPLTPGMKKSLKKATLKGGSDAMEAKAKRRPCGNKDCSTSTAIDEVTLTFGRGGLDDHGYWEIPCHTCAAAYQKDFQDHPVWPKAAKQR